MSGIPTGLSEAETHALLSDALIAPIPSTYRFDPAKQDIYELEHQAFDEHELSGKAIELSIALRRLVGGQLLPASLVVMEQYAEDYANMHDKSASRQERIAGHYKVGSMIGLGAASLTLYGASWNERHPDIVTSIYQDGIIACDAPSLEVVRESDFISKKIINTLGEQMTADVASHDADRARELTRASNCGYYVARTLAKLTIAPAQQ